MLEFATASYLFVGIFKSVLVILGAPVAAAVFDRVDETMGYSYYLLVIVVVGSFIAFFGWPWLLWKERSQFILMYSRFRIIRDVLEGMEPKRRARVSDLI